MKEMKANCKVGEETATSERGHSLTGSSLKSKYNHQKLKGKSKSHTSSDAVARTYDIKEWRIKYKCTN